MKTIKEHFGNKKICILGFGREGRSSLQWLHDHLSGEWKSITVADQNPAALNDPLLDEMGCKLKYGYDYMAGLNDFDMIIKSPGINLTKSDEFVPEGKITSQSDIFLQFFSKQCIGITGTKGKSTTSSLLYDMMLYSGKKALLIGNIGIPPFDAWNQIDDQTVIIFELSSHQLEYIEKGPAVAVLLNLFQEHLDHYKDFRHYQLAKLNITAKQQSGDLLITHLSDQRIHRLINESAIKRRILYFSLEEHEYNGMYLDNNNIMLTTDGEHQVLANQEDLQYLNGVHNVLNVMAASLAAIELNCSIESVKNALRSFRGLPHRMEHVGEWNGVTYYNDAIATIPEATMAAVEAIDNIGTLIVGGFDRGVDYAELANFLIYADIDNIVFMGDAGERLFGLMKNISGHIAQKTLWTNDLGESVEFARKNTKKGKTCLLSPAAPSYDKYKNFMEKGEDFKRLVEPK